MIKAFAILLNVFGFLFVGLFADSDILIDNNTPATLEPGVAKEVSLVITKGDVQGFSKLELNLPYGFTATPGDIKGASFTFSGQKAKFVWMTLPVDASFTITYSIESAPNMEGNYDIAGTFSYVKENKREDIVIPSKTVVVQKQIGPSPEEVAATMPGVKIEEMVADMYCEREVTKLSDTEYTITLRVKNNQIKDLFGRILETVPYGCNTEVTNDAGATVTELANTIKFVWFQTPNADAFDCSYKITCSDAMAQPEISGIFSYSLDQVPYEQKVTNVGEPYSAPYIKTANNNGTIAQNNTTTNTNTTGNSNTSNTIETNTSTNTQNTDNNTASANNTSIDENAVTNIPAPETGITYKVQILAAHRVVNKTFLKKTYGFTQAYNIENIDGWVKYTTGKFIEYKQARAARETLKSKHGKLPGPFVTAYSDGERITVQEALLLSSQQWIQ
ncbi:MAG: hypothetical protein ACKVOR_06630 [Flavobacteriales bacterium]